MTRPRQCLVSFFRCLLGTAVYLMVMHVCISLHQMGLPVKKNIVILSSDRALAIPPSCNLAVVILLSVCKDGFLAKKRARGSFG